MIIENLKLKNFKKFQTLDLSFKPGLNIVRGPNEQGKSTLVAALTAALFFDPLKKNQAIKSNQSWFADKLYQIQMTFFGADQRFLLQKDFEEKFLLLQNLTAKTNFKTFPETEQAITSLTGIASPSFFESTALIRQERISKLDTNKNEIAKALQSLITSGGDTHSALEIIKKLDQRIAAQLKGINRPAIDPGPIKKITDALEAKSAQLAELKEKFADRARRERENKDLRARLNQLQRDYKVKKELLDKNQILLEVDKNLKAQNAELDRLQQKINQIEKTGRALSEVNQKITAHPLLKTNPDSLKEKISRLEESLKLRRLDLDRATQVQPKAQAPSTKPSSMILAVAGIIGLTSLALGFLVSPYIYLSLVLAAAVAGYAFYQAKAISAEPAPAEPNRADALQQELNSLENQHRTLLDSVNCQSVDDFQKIYQEYEQLNSQLTQLQATKEGLLNGQDFTELEKNRAKIIKTIALEEAKVDEKDQALKLEPEKLQALMIETASLEQEIGQLQEQGIANKAVLGQAQVNREQLVSLEEEIAELKEKLTQEKTRLAVYQVTRETLFEAKEAAAASGKDQLEAEISTQLPRITNNRYQKVELDENLNLAVLSPEAKVTISPDLLSRGTIDQLYLTVRFAFLKFLSADQAPPIILDDPFVTFDSTRLAAAMKLIKHYAQKYQIFLFTHSPQYDQWGNHLVDLAAIQNVNKNAHALAYE